MRTHNRIAVPAAIVALGLVLAACSSPGEEAPAPEGDETSATSEESEPSTGGVLEYAAPDQPGTGGLDPFVATNAASASYLSLIYETLLVRDEADNSIQPSLAASYEQVDPLTYDFVLRDDVLFSDGTEMTVDDVVFSFEQWLESTSSRVQFLRGIDTIEATDDSTVRFTFAEPNGGFMNAMSSANSFYVVSQAWYESATEDERQREALGTGPFTLGEWVDGVSLTLEKNEVYWQEGLPRIDGINFQIVPDESSRLALVQQGSVDMAAFTDMAVAGQAEGAGFTIGEASYTRKISIYLNPTSGPLADIRVRRALSLSLDRAQLVELGAGGAGAVSLTVPPGDPAALDIDDTTPYYTRDLEEARALLAEAGQTDPVIQLHYPSDYTTDDIPIFEVMKEQAAEAGITLDLVATPWSEISRIFTYSEPWTDMVAIWNRSNADPSGYFTQFLVEGGQMAYFGDDPEADGARELYAQIMVETDIDTRAQLVDELNLEVADKVLKLVALAKAERIEVWDPDTVSGYTPDAWSLRMRLRELTLG